MAKNDALKGSRDGQVITLLNTIGERLIRSEAERRDLQQTVNRYGKIINELGDKTDKSANLFITLQSQIGRSEAAERKLREDQNRFEEMFSSQMEKIEKAAALAERIEEAIAQQSRLTRRMEGISQDKIKMLRKLERIEETVMETQNALNSKALVLLTDQKVAEKSWMPHTPVNDAPDFMKKTRSSKPRLGQSARMAGVAALVLIAATAGWAAYQFQTSAQISAAGTAGTAATAVAANQTPAAQPEQELAQTADQAEEPSDSGDALPGDDITAQDAENAQSADKKAQQLASATSGPSSAALSPDDVAAQMNAIEPGDAADTEDKQDALPPIPATSAVAMPVTQAKFAAPPAQTLKAQPEVSVDAFLKSQQVTGPLASRITPDLSLPPVVKDVEKKAFQGVPEAQHDLAAIYTAGQAGVKIDYVRASLWFREAALNGIANARYNLGVLYHQGLGVKQNIGMAISWYTAAAELGHPEAEYNLGIAHIQGVGTDYSPQKAAVYFEKAARSGIMEAAFNLGLIEENGLLGHSDPEKALFWYKKAADQGSKEAKSALDQIVKAQGYKQEDIDRIMRDAQTADSASAPVKKSEAAPVKTTLKSKVAPPPPPQQAAAQPLNENDVADMPPLPVPQAHNNAIADSQVVVSQIQQQLIRLGLYPGPADGVDNSMTGDAIRTYQQMNGLQADGRASQTLLLHMKSAALGGEIGKGATEQGSRDE